MIKSQISPLFLEVDGVLNTGRGPLLHEKVDHLAHIIRKRSPQIVVTSTWRTIPHQWNRLTAVLENINAGKILTTPTLKTYAPDHLVRSREITQWLADHDHPEHFVIVDDQPVIPELFSHQVQTNSSEGLTPAKTAQIITALSPTHPMAKPFRTHQPLTPEATADIVEELRRSHEHPQAKFEILAEHYRKAQEKLARLSSSL